MPPDAVQKYHLLRLLVQKTYFRKKDIFTKSENPTVGGGVRKARFKGGSGVELSFSGFCEIAAYVNLGVTLKRLRGVHNAVVVVEES